MTTTLRPTGPLQQGADGAKARSLRVCVNSRPVGAVELRTDTALGSGWGAVSGLRIEEPDRGRGRGTVAALAAEEVLRGWGCTHVRASVPADATAGLRTGHRARLRRAQPPACSRSCPSSRPHFPPGSWAGR